ncbi:MAG TPA: hypothetical protein VEB64_11995 [Azospirillaceae bacterium]|nr:hypothetical protein [Azospirillaceae bacterium]
MQIHPIDGAAPRVATDPHAEAPKPHGHSPADSAVGAPGQDQTATAPAYPNPVLRFDPSSGVAVLQFRDSNTGEARYQYPSERAVMEYRHQMRATRGVSNADLDQA